MTRLLQIACLWLLAAGAWAQGGVLELGAQDNYKLAPYVTYLEDVEGKLALDDILQPAQQARFRPMRGSGPAANFGLTRSAIWLRVELQAPAGQDPN
jgi:hypothetical protein